MILRTVILQAFLYLIICMPLPSHAGNSYKIIDEDKSTIIFNYDQKSLPGIIFSLKGWDDGYKRRQFFAGNSNYNSIGLNNWVGIWNTDLSPGRHYQTSYSLINGLPKWGAFKNRQNLIGADGQINGALGVFDFLMFQSNGVPCAIFSATFGEDSFHSSSYTGTTRVTGVLCTTEKAPLSQTNIENLVNAIGLKGHAEPTGKRFSLATSGHSDTKVENQKRPQDSPTSTPTTNTKESDLKEAKDLFSKGLISEKEYVNLKKKILNIN